MTVRLVSRDELRKLATHLATPDVGVESVTDHLAQLPRFQALLAAQGSSGHYLVAVRVVLQGPPQVCVCRVGIEKSQRVGIRAGVARDRAPDRVVDERNASEGVHEIGHAEP